MATLAAHGGTMTVAPDRRKVVWSLACLFDMPLLLEVEDCSDLSLFQDLLTWRKYSVFLVRKAGFFPKLAP